MKQTIPLVLALLSVTLPGCESGPESKDPQKDIVGKWACESGKLSLEVTPDGKLTFANAVQKGVTLKGTGNGKAFVDATHIVGVWTPNFDVYEVHIRGSHMKLVPQSGSATSCTRSP